MTGVSSVLRDAQRVNLLGAMGPVAKALEGYQSQMTGIAGLHKLAVTRAFDSVIPASSVLRDAQRVNLLGAMGPVAKALEGYQSQMRRVAGLGQLLTDESVLAAASQSGVERVDLIALASSVLSVARVGSGVRIDSGSAKILFMMVAAVYPMVVAAVPPAAVDVVNAFFASTLGVLALLAATK